MVEGMTLWQNLHKKGDLATAFLHAVMGLALGIKSHPRP